MEYIDITIFIGIILGLLALTILVNKKMREPQLEKEIDYKAFYVMGISLIPIGIILTTVISPAFICIAGAGASFVFFGLRNKDKWQTDQEI